MTNPNEFSPSFNLWSEDWITLECADGQLVDVSIQKALLEADRFVAIYDPSPLVVVGIHRLLTAILQDAINPQENGDLELIWQAGFFPADKINEFAQQYADRFDLFSPDKPFLQSADLPLFPKTKDELKQKKPVAKLFPETPSGTEVAHYRHRMEDEIVLSPASAALGLIIMPPFMSSGGGGGEFMPSINGAPPPIYVLPGGRSLFESLFASLIARTQLEDQLIKKDMAWWKRPAPVIIEKSKKKKVGMNNSEHKQLSQVGYLHGLTFPPRKVRLHPEKLNMTCSRSGKVSEWCVCTMAFQMGESILDEGGNWWRDPFVAYRLPDKGKSVPKTIKAGRNKSIWREFAGLFLIRNEDDRQAPRPRFLDQMGQLYIDRDMLTFPFRCVALVAKADAKKFDWFDYGFDVPPSLLQDLRGKRYVDEALAFATNCASTSAGIFSRKFGRATKNSERLKRLKEHMMTEYWSILAGKFRQFVLNLADREQQGQTLEYWKSTVIHEAQKAFDAAADATGDDGASLHRIEDSKAKCHIALFQLRNTQKGG